MKQKTFSALDSILMGRFLEQRTFTKPAARISQQAALQLLGVSSKKDLEAMYRAVMYQVCPNAGVPKRFADKDGWVHIKLVEGRENLPLAATELLLECVKAGEDVKAAKNKAYQHLASAVVSKYIQPAIQHRLAVGFENTIKSGLAFDGGLSATDKMKIAATLAIVLYAGYTKDAKTAIAAMGDFSPIEGLELSRHVELLTELADVVENAYSAYFANPNVRPPDTARNAAPLYQNYQELCTAGDARYRAALKIALWSVGLFPANCETPIFHPYDPAIWALKLL